jgi:glycosyltransferase involved in cell wall biosynthesis
VTKSAYTFPILRIEGAAALHMLRRRGAVYHVLYGDTDVWMLGRIGRVTGNAVVASFHDGDDVLASLDIDERLTARLSAVICLAESQRPYFERLMPSERIFVVPHGVHTGYFTPPEEPSSERVCITVGGHTRDFETLARAIKIVRETDPTVRFVAVSTHIGHKGAPFECEGVEFRTKISDDELLAAYRSSCLAVFAFEWAVANNSLLEAMACGLPVVATGIGGVSEYVGSEAGILCEPKDPVALAGAMLRILDDPGLTWSMRAAARRRAITYDYQHVAAQLAEVYRRSLSLDGLSR